MRTLSDLQQRILREEYPNMDLESDSDVERYFELRQNGRQAEALALYNSRLKRKYPDERQREELMRCYRSRDPRYRTILRESLVGLADRLVTRTTYIISLLTKDIDSVDMTDAYSVIKLAEGLLGIISPDRYQAIAFTEKYVRYAKALGYRERQMERTAELIRLYVTDTIESVQELKREKAERRRQHARAQERNRGQTANFDLSRIVFSQADIARILIPHGVTRTEDIVIAYCLRYWNLVGDPAFEKTVFLYSRKNRTNHHDIFQAVKNGREHNWKDEEILNAVLANVVTGYYYNISGDLYLQRAWARCKASAALGETALPAPEPAQPPKGARKPRAARKAPAARKGTSGKDKATSAPRKAAKKVVSPKREKVRPVQPFRTERSAGRGSAVSLPPAPAFRPNSVADIIKKMTGKTYTVYKELFFRSIRPSIRVILAASREGKGNLFGSRQNSAEELVYSFLYDHYNDPYLDWKGSSEKTGAEELGYLIPEIEPVIEHWIQHNQQN